MKKIILVLLLAGSAQAKNLIPELAQKGLPHWNKPKIIRQQLANGFQLYLLPDSSLPLFRAKLYLQTGSAYLPYKKSGLADLALVTWITGGTQTKTPQEVDQWLEANAIDIGSDAGRELTTMSLSCLASQVPEALAFFQELLSQPRFDSDRFELAKKRYQEGVRRLKDHPGELLEQTFRELLYGSKHPWGSHPSLKSLKAIGREDVTGFYQQNFNPKQMLLAVAGDFDPKAIQQWVEAHFGKLNPKPIPNPDWSELPLATQPETKRVKKKLTQAFIEAGHLSLVRGDEQKYAYSLLQYLLGGDVFTSRLGKELRTRLGLAYSIYSHWDLNPVRGMFKIHIETKKESEDLVLAKIKEHLMKIQAGDITETELAQAKEALLNQYIFWFDSPFDLVEQQAHLDLLGYEKDYLEKYPERLRQVTLKDVQAAAKKYIQPGQLKVVIVGP